MSDYKSPKKNVFDLSRYRGRNTRSRANGGAHNDQGRLKRQGGSKTPTNQLRWFHYAQFIIFLLVLAYFMRRCRS